MKIEKAEIHHPKASEQHAEFLKEMGFKVSLREKTLKIRSTKRAQIKRIVKTPLFRVCDPKICAFLRKRFSSLSGYISVNLFKKVTFELSPRSLRRFVIFTSGGDSPGMNCLVRAVVLSSPAKVFGCYSGFDGLINNDLKLLNADFVSEFGMLGGTFLKSARSSEFLQRSGRKKAVLNLLKNRIDAVIAVGGDGTMRGLKVLEQEYVELVSELIAEKAVKKGRELKIVAIPATIDNDIAFCDITIGASSCLHRVVDCIDSLATTMASHGRCFVVETMGRDCGWIALFSHFAVNAEFVFLPEVPHDRWETQVVTSVVRARVLGKSGCFVVVSEGALDVHGNKISSEDVRKVLEEEAECECRVLKLGHIQRGGSPSAYDRVLATMLGCKAVEYLMGLTGNLRVFKQEKFTSSKDQETTGKDSDVLNEDIVHENNDVEGDKCHEKDKMEKIDNKTRIKTSEPAINNIFEDTPRKKSDVIGNNKSRNVTHEIFEKKRYSDRHNGSYNSDIKELHKSNVIRDSKNSYDGSVPNNGVVFDYTSNKMVPQDYTNMAEPTVNIEKLIKDMRAHVRNSHGKHEYFATAAVATLYESEYIVIPLDNVIKLNEELESLRKSKNFKALLDARGVLFKRVYMLSEQMRLCSSSLDIHESRRLVALYQGDDRVQVTDVQDLKNRKPYNLNNSSNDTGSSKSDSNQKRPQQKDINNENSHKGLIAGHDSRFVSQQTQAHSKNLEKQSETRNHSELIASEKPNQESINPHIENMISSPENSHLAILHIGERACGANTAIHIAVRYAKSLGFLPLIIQNGFDGLLTNSIEEPQTYTYTDRFHTNTPAVRAGKIPKNPEKILESLQKNKIKKIIVIGNREAVKAVRDIQNIMIETKNFNCSFVILPVCFENSLPLCSETIGADSALNFVIAACDSLRNSATTDNALLVAEIHESIGMLTALAAVAAGADATFMPNTRYSANYLAKQSKRLLPEHSKSQSQHKSEDMKEDEVIYGQKFLDKKLNRNLIPTQSLNQVRSYDEYNKNKNTEKNQDCIESNGCQNKSHFKNCPDLNRPQKVDLGVSLEHQVGENNLKSSVHNEKENTNTKVHIKEIQYASGFEQNETICSVNSTTKHSSQMDPAISDENRHNHEVLMENNVLQPKNLNIKASNAKICASVGKNGQTHNIKSQKHAKSHKQKRKHRNNSNLPNKQPILIIKNDKSLPKISQKQLTDILADKSTETRKCFLGDLIHGGQTSPFDRILASICAIKAVDILAFFETERQTQTEYLAHVLVKKGSTLQLIDAKSICKEIEKTTSRKYRHIEKLHNLMKRW